MAKWNYIYIHEQLIVIDTGSAILIKLPQLINSIEWGIWMPRKLVKNPIEKYRKQLVYPEDFKFRAVPLNCIGDERKELTEKEILNQFNSDVMREMEVEQDLNLYIEKLNTTIELFRNDLIEIQTIDGCPETIHNLIEEADVDELDLLVENIELAKKQWFK